MGVPNGDRLYTTIRGGNQAILLWDATTGIKPLIGAYLEAGNWYPLSWTRDGKYDSTNTDRETKLDLVPNEAAKV